MIRFDPVGDEACSASPIIERWNIDRTLAAQKLVAEVAQHKSALHAQSEIWFDQLSNSKMAALKSLKLVPE